MNKHGDKRGDFTWDAVWKAWTRDNARIYPFEDDRFVVSIDSVWEPGEYEWDKAVALVEGSAS